MTVIKFIKNKDNKIWFSEWNIFFNGNYDGMIYKCQKGQKWRLVSNRFNIYATSPFHEHKTLGDAKKCIRELVESENKMTIDELEKENKALQEKLDVAVEALKEIKFYSPSCYNKFDCPYLNENQGCESTNFCHMGSVISALEKIKENK